MLCYMERNADGLAILITQRNLYIHLASFHILAEYPHLTFLIKHVYHRALNIIFSNKALYNYLTL